MRSSKNGTPRERIARALDAGAVCFAEKGFFEATLNDVISESGLSRSTIYWHFDSKEALYDAVIERCAARLEAAYDAGVDGLEGSGPLIGLFLRNVVRDVDSQKEAYRVLYLAPRPATAAAEITRLTRRFVSYVRLVVQAARRRGELEVVAHSDGALVDVLHALAEGLVIRRLCDEGFDADGYVATATALLTPAGPRAQ